MLEITPIQTKEQQKEICELCGIDFNADCLAYSATENGKIIGITQFRIFGEYAVIYDLANAAGIEDKEILIILEKAALNFINSCDIKEVILTNGGKINSEGYFESPCQQNKHK